MEEIVITNWKLMLPIPFMKYFLFGKMPMPKVVGLTFPLLTFTTHRHTLLGETMTAQGQHSGRERTQEVFAWAFTNFDIEGLETAVQVEGTLNDNSDIDKGWSVEIAIPWSSLALLANGRSLPPAGGDIWSLFLGRFQKLVLGGKEVQPHPATALNSYSIYDTHLPEKWSKVAFVV